MKNLDLSKTNLRKFSITMFVALSICGTIMLWGYKNTYIWFYSAAALLLLLGIFAVDLLKPVYIAWMGLAFILAWLNTRLLF